VVEIRRAESDADLTAWREVYIAVVPNEIAATVEQMRASMYAEHVRLLAEVDGEVVGSGVAGPSDFPGAVYLAPRVPPVHRRRGYGTELLRALLEHAVTPEREVAVAYVDDHGSLAFAERFGFQEFDRQVEQVRPVGPADAAPVRVPDGVEIVTVKQRPELWAVAYEAVGQQAFQDMALVTPISVSLEQWEQIWISDPDAMFVALADGDVIGTAGLILDSDQPHRAENALTVVRRDWRGRGVALALKRKALAWAAEHDITEVYTWTQRGNDDMRKLNERLDYVYRSETINVRAPLPVEV
jgi:RimJ/RimL family protein N-acetyltransferase